MDFEISEEQKEILYNKNRDKSEDVCLKCKGTGIVKDKSGVHVCFDCLRAGKLDPYSKNVKDSGIRI